MSHIRRGFEKNPIECVSEYRKLDCQRQVKLERVPFQAHNGIKQGLLRRLADLF